MYREKAHNIMIEYGGRRGEGDGEADQSIRKTK